MKAQRIRAALMAAFLTVGLVSTAPEPATAGAAPTIAPGVLALTNDTPSYGTNESIQYAKKIFTTSIGGQQIGRYSRLSMQMFGPANGRQGQGLASSLFAPDVIGKGDTPYAFRGEIIEVNDLAKDGYRVGVRWTNSGGKKGLCINKLGKSNTDTAYCDLPNLPEGSRTKVKLGRCNGSATGCNELSDWQWWNHYEPIDGLDGQLKKGVWLDYTDDADSSPDGGECTEIGTRKDC